jgi:hypothetical protein
MIYFIHIIRLICRMSEVYIFHLKYSFFGMTVLEVVVQYEKIFLPALVLTLKCQHVVITYSSKNTRCVCHGLQYMFTVLILNSF